MVGSPGGSNRVTTQAEGPPREPCGRAGWLAAFITLLLIAFGVGIASADEEAQDRGVPSTEDIIQQIEAGASSSVDLPSTDAEAAAVLPHRDLDRDEAAALLEGVFDDQLQAPAGIFDDLNVVKFLGPNVALVDGAGSATPGLSAPEGEPSGEDEVEPSSDEGSPANVHGDGQLAGASLLEASIPLRTEPSTAATAAIDLSLQHENGEIQPENPLVEVDIPQTLGEGIELPGAGVTIGLAGGPDSRTPSVIDGSAGFLPNVAPDTDLVIAPTPTGVETLTQLRSAESPRSQTFTLDLPAGATLKATKDGGAVVQGGEETLLGVAPPTAIDATGASVPVDITVNDNSLTLSVSVDESTSFPVLVDPLYQTYDWAKSKYWKSGICNSSFSEEVFSSCDDHEEWSYEVINKGNSFPGPIRVDNRSWSWNVPVPLGTPGLSIGSSGSVTTGSKGSINYTVPRYFTDYKNLGVRPSSFIAQMTLWNLDWNALSSHLSPYIVAGVWDTVKGASVSYYSHEGLEGHSLSDMSWQYKFPNPNSNTNAKVGYVSVQATETQPNENADLYVGSASIQLGDLDVPGFGSLSGPSQWVDQTALPINFNVSDSGLGVQSLTLSDQGAAPKSWKTSYGCIGVGDAACPRSWKSTDAQPPVPKYEPAVLPQGTNNLNVVAEDPVGNKSATGVAQVKVDHTVPSLSLSGSLADHAAKGTLSGNYALKYNAIDGFDVTPSALTPIGPAGTGEAKAQRPMGITADAQGHVWMADRENSRVVEFTEEGKYLGQFGSYGTGNGQFLDPRGIALAPNGTLWVVDTARGRIQQFNQKGEFLQGFGTKVSAPNPNDPTAFVEPWGVSAAPNGQIWVADVGAGRVSLFNESAVGQARFDREAYGSPSNGNGKAELAAPVGIATNASGNIWVVENGASRVDVFDSNGQFQTRFGSEGTGNRQFKAPVGVAIAPTGHVFVVDAGNNRVQEFLANGAYLRQFASTGTASNQLQEPRGITIGAGNTAFVADAANHRVARWAGVDTDPQSGAASTEVKVDGSLVEPKYSPGCSTKNCSINREWTLDANDYSSGQHKIQVTVTDAVGLTTTRELTLTTDNTPPEITATNNFFTAPEGWLEQKSYLYSPEATDAGGYGATALTLKIDGKVVKSMTQSCPNGGCSATLLGSIDMSTYEGGSHPAELIATDGAGNTRKKPWTINVDPEGQVSVEEAVDTLDAVGETSETDLVASTDELINAEERADGNNPSLVENDDLLESRGVPNPSAVSTDPEEGFTVVLPDSTLSAQPVNVGGSATELEISDGSVALAGNTTSNVDTVIRPIFDGVLTFSSIRDKSATETFSWEVQLSEGQSLKQTDPMDAEIVYEDGTRAVLITAEKAHDAIGTEVPTTLSVSEGNILTLMVVHKGASYVYPVITGAGWEGGYATEIVVGPKDDQEVKEEHERILQEEHEAMERAAEQELTPGDEPPGEGMEVSHPERVQRVIVNVGPPEMYDWVHRKRRSKAEAAYCNKILGQTKCDNWHTWEVGTWFWNGTYHHVGGYAWRGNTTAKCYSHDGLLFDDNLTTMGWSGPDPAPYGYGKYLNLWCNFNVGWFNLNDYEIDYYQVQDHLYGDGYQGQHLKDMPPPYLE
jgi:hypothetical protein